nr:MAG TPA: hypothetical protein [Caudoviricetes sp.]DAJ68133.1 MAG TPA: hypothetical protein [Caudoviricetes sp.]
MEYNLIKLYSTSFFPKKFQVWSEVFSDPHERHKLFSVI